MAGPSDTVDHLTEAINRGDLEAALALYEPNAVLVVQPGHLACGATQLREALARFSALRPSPRPKGRKASGRAAFLCNAAAGPRRGLHRPGPTASVAAESWATLRHQGNGRWLM